MVFTLAGMLIVLYSLHNYKKGLLVYLAFKLLLVTNITLISVPGIPLLTLEDFLNIFFVLYFLFLNRCHSSRGMILVFPWKLPFVVLSISVLLSSFFAVAGFVSEITAYIKFIFENILLIWVIWENIQTEKDFRFVFKLITCVFFVSCVYGIIEFMIGSNPIQIFEAGLNRDAAKQLVFSYSLTDRGYRISSFFEHAIGAGINWSVYLGFVLYFCLNKKEKLPFHKLAVLTACLCVFCVFLTKMRSPIVFMVLICIGALNFKKKRTYKIALLGVAALFLFVFVADESSEVFRVMLSFFSLKSGSSVGGSTLEGRLNQLDVAMKLMSSNPLFGLGVKYQSVLRPSLYREIWGSEGLLLYVLPSFGLMGLFSYICFFWFSIIRIPKRFNSWPLSFLFFAYLVTYTLSSLPGMKISLIYLYAYYLIKSSKKYITNNSV